MAGVISQRRWPVAERLREWLVAKCMALKAGGARGSLRNVSVGASGLPDSGDLKSHYDATELSLNDGDTVSTFTAQVGPDLAAVGGPTYRTNVQNGNAVVDYDGADDGHDANFASSESQPFQIFGVARFESTGSGGGATMFGTTGDSNNRAWLYEDGSANFAMNSGAGDISDGSTDTNFHVFNMLFDGANSRLRIDGSQVASGDLGSSNYTGVALAWLEWNNGNYGDVHVGEYFSYPSAKTGVEGDAESYLANKWGIAI